MSFFNRIKAILLFGVMLFALGHNAFPHVHQHITDIEHQTQDHGHHHNHQHEGHHHQKSSEDWKGFDFLQLLLDGHTATNHTHHYTPLLLEQLKSKKQFDQRLIDNFGQYEIVFAHWESDLKPGFSVLICPFESLNLSINPLRGPPSKV